MSPVRLLLDECLPLAIEVALQRRAMGGAILRVGRVGAPPKGASDAELLLWCESADVVLVTLDRRTMPDHFAAHLAAAHHSAGVFLLRRDTPMAQLIDDLLLVIEASTTAEWRDRIMKLPL